jgi:hypothetical protein
MDRSDRPRFDMVKPDDMPKGGKTAYFEMQPVQNEK